MIVRTMWGVRHGYNNPELMVAWDELCVDENPEGFDDDCERSRKSWGEDLKAERFIDIVVDVQQINEHFRSKNVVGAVKGP